MRYDSMIPAKAPGRARLSGKKNHNLKEIYLFWGAGHAGPSWRAGVRSCPGIFSPGRRQKLVQHRDGASRTN